MAVTSVIPANQQPDLADVLDLAMRRMALNLRVCVPAKVVRVLGPQFVDLQPLLQKNVDGVLTDYPVVTGALVNMPVGGDFQLSYSLKPGDTGMMLCADRSLDAYAASDGTTPVDPADARAHQLTDAIFVPGLLPHSKQTVVTDDMVLRNGDMTLRLQKSGTITASNGTNELMALLVQTAQQMKTLADNLVSAQVLTALGPAPFLASSVTLFQQVSTNMLDVTNRLNTLKGS